MKSKLALIESRLQAIIEGGTAKLFQSNGRQNNLAYRLVEAMQRGIRQKSNGTPVAPNLYTVRGNPGQVQALYSNRALLQSLAQTLREAGDEAGFTFISAPVIRLEAANELAPGEWDVYTQNTQHDLPRTSDLAPGLLDEATSIPPNAFLIVNGSQIYNLNQPVVTIGRRADNHLVINDTRISRVHAQLRAVRGRYYVFDLGSTGGTQLNGRPVQKAALTAGDVISLAGVPLVYGQDGDDTEDDDIIDTEVFRPGRLDDILGNGDA